MLETIAYGFIEQCMMRVEVKARSTTGASRPPLTIEIVRGRFRHGGSRDYSSSGPYATFTRVDSNRELGP